MSEAIRLQPDYQKAYARRHRYYYESRRWRDALVDVLASSHLKAVPLSVEESLRVLECASRLGDERHEQWKRELRASGGLRVVPVKHQKAYRWLTGVRSEDALLGDVKAFARGELRDQGVYSQALQLFIEKNYDDIDGFIHERRDSLGGRAAECWLLAALILALKGDNKSHECLSRAEQLLADRPDDARRHSLLVSAHIIRIETVWTTDDIVRTWRSAVAFSPRTTDFYTHAALRLVTQDAVAEEVTIMQDPRVGQSDDKTVLHHLMKLRMAECEPGPHLAALQQFEFVLRVFDLPGYLSSHLPPFYAFHGYRREAMALARELAERDDYTGMWYKISTFTDSPAEKLQMLNKVLSIEPNHTLANIDMIKIEMQRLEEGGLSSRARVAPMLARIERALATFDDSMNETALCSLFRMHETVKARMRAMELLNLE